MVCDCIALIKIKCFYQNNLVKAISWISPAVIPRASSRMDQVCQPLLAMAKVEIKGITLELK
jgi:hypothetical protein